jgi:hypothetical protein
MTQRAIIWYFVARLPCKLAGGSGGTLRSVNAFVALRPLDDEY